MFGDVDWPIVKEVWVVMVDSCIEFLCEVSGVCAVSSNYE